MSQQTVKTCKNKSSSLWGVWWSQLGSNLGLPDVVRSIINHPHNFPETDGRNDLLSELWKAVPCHVGSYNNRALKIQWSVIIFLMNFPYIAINWGISHVQETPKWAELLIIIGYMMLYQLISYYIMIYYDHIWCPNMSNRTIVPLAFLCGLGRALLKYINHLYPKTMVT